MNIFKPNFYIHDIKSISYDFFKSHHISGIILDTDNTLTTHGNAIPADGIIPWINFLKASGMKLIILSNNTSARISPFAEILSIPFVSTGAKPLKRGFIKCCKALNLKSSEVCIIGDQIFTDILGGNRCKIKTILTDPIEYENGIFFKLKRFIERTLIKNLTYHNFD